MSTFTLEFESGENSLSVRRVEVHEALNELFTVSVWARSMLWDIELGSLVGKTASLEIQPGTANIDERHKRRWKGVCSHVEQVQAEPTGLSTYYLRIVPSLWLLTQRRSYRIYQHLSIPEIIKSLLGEWKIDARWAVDEEAHPKREYKVQHGESDYAFFCRLLEEAGITYSFPDDAKSTLFLSDMLEAEEKRPGAAIPYTDNPNQSAEYEFVSKLRLSHEVRPGAATVRGYDFRRPEPILEANTTGDPYTATYEQYYYEPGALRTQHEVDGFGQLVGTWTPARAQLADQAGHYYSDFERGVDASRRLLNGVRADMRAVQFESNVLDLYPGRLFQVEQHPHPDLGEEHLMATQLQIVASPDEPWRIQGRAIFSNSKLPYRPIRKTPKPVVSGVQTATVVGDGEIYADEFGRVRVQFHWDRQGQNNKYSSCWIRVSQPWAGDGFGMIAIPRVGQEVLVAYLDGDPDLPVIVGRAFNQTHPVPYQLPDNGAVSGFKSRSTPATTAGGYNEIKFDDTAASELFYVRAERDKHHLVRRDEVERTLGVKRSKVDGDEHLYVTGNRRRFVNTDDHLHVVGKRIQVVDESVSLTVKRNRDEEVGGNYAVKGEQEIHIAAGTTLVLEAGFRLTIKVGSNFIDIHPGGIDIVGTIVNINSGGSAANGRGANPAKATDPKTNLEVSVLDADEADPKDTPSP